MSEKDKCFSSWACYFTGYLGNETSLITGLLNIEAAQNWALAFTFICWASSPTSPNQVEKKIIEQRRASLPLLQRREAVFNYAKYKWDSRRNAASCGEHDRDDVIWLKDSKKRRRGLTQAWVPLSLSLSLHLRSLFPAITLLAFLLFLHTNCGPVWGILHLFLPETFFPQFFSNTPSPHTVHLLQHQVCKESFLDDFI